jgi:hypothetical protein
MSTMSFRKPYPPEFRRDAVLLVRSSGRSMRQLARELVLELELEVHAHRIRVAAISTEHVAAAAHVLDDEVVIAL